MKKVLFVLTSHEALGNTGQKTGFWIEEFASPYYHLVDSGVNVALCTPVGGKAPSDPKSNEPSAQTPATIRFNDDVPLQERVSNTLSLASINPADFDAVSFPGGHGPLWDLAENSFSIALIEHFYKSNKPIGAVCHGPIAFKNTKNEAGEPLVMNKKVTSFTNSEETAIALDQIVPYSVEDELKRNGGIFSKGNDWQTYAVEDKILITGQNPASSVLVAQLLLNQLT